MRMQFVEITPIDTVPNGYRVDGSLDMITTRDVRTFMDGVHSGPLLLDLARVRFLDTVGLRLLVELSQRSEERPSLVILNPSPAVKRVLRVCYPQGIPQVEVQSTSGVKSAL